MLDLFETMENCRAMRRLKPDPVPDDLVAKILHAGVPFAEPDLESAPDRLQAVLEAVYAVFTQGWSDPAGADEAARFPLCRPRWRRRVRSSIRPTPAPTLRRAARARSPAGI